MTASHPHFDAGEYHVVALRWFGRGRVLVEESSTGFTAPLWGLLPGERATVFIEDGLLRNARVLSETIRNRSPWRVPPRCSQAAICPGCSLLHVSEEGRDHYHRTLMQEVMTRFAGATDLPLIRVIRGVEGDHRVVTRVWLQAATSIASHQHVFWQVGMRQRDRQARALVDFSECQANARVLRQAAHALQSLPVPHQLSSTWQPSSPYLDMRQDDTHLWIDVSAWPELIHQTIIQHLQNACGDAWIVAPMTEEQPWHPANPPMQDRLYREVVQRLPHPHAKVFDLTCGEGGLSVMLAQAGAEVWASDRHWAAVQRTDELAKMLKLPNLHTRGGKADVVLQGAEKRGEQVDVIIINPMREPVGDPTMQYVHQSGAHILFYLAPAPKAGAKDLATLIQHHWRIRSCDAFVLHPWTGAPMLFAQLERDEQP